MCGSREKPELFAGKDRELIGLPFLIPMPAVAQLDTDAELQSKCLQGLDIYKAVVNYDGSLPDSRPEELL